MIGRISELAIGLAELCEAEGRVVRHQIDRLVRRIVLVLAAALVALAGLTILTIGVYGILAKAVGTHQASVLIGIGLLLLAGVMFSISQSIIKDRS